MSCNIDSSKLLCGKLFIKARDYTRLHREYCDDMAEFTVFDYSKILNKAASYLESGNPDKLVELNGHSLWNAEHSGYTYNEILIEKLLPLTKGRADYLLVWETGDITGLRVVDGVVTEPNVTWSLEG